MLNAEEKVQFALLFEAVMDFFKKKFYDMASKETYEHLKGIILF